MALSTETKTTIVFVVLGVLAWLIARTYSSNEIIALAALIGIGVVLPTLINEFRGA